MAFNGSGTYNPTGVPVVTGTPVSSSTYNSTITDISTALSDCITRDGQSPATGNIPMGTYRHTGLGVGVIATDSANLGQIQAQNYSWGGTAGGSLNALTITPSPAITAYTAGMRFAFKAASSNSGATTIAINGLSAIPIQVNGSACVGGELIANSFYEILFDTNSTCQFDNVFATCSVTQPGGTNNTTIATTAFVTGATFPSGTRMSFNQTAAPTGWTKDTTAALNDTAMRIVTGTVGSGGSVAFSTVFGRTASDGYTLLVADIPSHTHNTSTGTTPGISGTVYAEPSYGAISGTITTASQTIGGDGSHSHGMDIRVKYNDFIIASKN